MKEATVENTKGRQTEQEEDDSWTNVKRVEKEGDERRGRNEAYDSKDKSITS